MRSSTMLERQAPPSPAAGWKLPAAPTASKAALPPAELEKVLAKRARAAEKKRKSRSEETQEQREKRLAGMVARHKLQKLL